MLYSITELSCSGKTQVVIQVAIIIKRSRGVEHLVGENSSVLVVEPQEEIEIIFCHSEEETDKQQAGMESSKGRTASKTGLLKRNHKGETELHLACIRQDLAQVKALLKSGIDVNHPDFAGWTPLHEAAIRGNRVLVEVLLRAGAQVNASSMNGDTPLHDAARSGSCEVVQLLLQHGAHPQNKNSKGHSAIDLAQNRELKALLQSFQHFTAPGTSRITLHKSTAPSVVKKQTGQTTESKPLEWLLSEVEERLTHAGGWDAEKYSAALWDTHMALAQALDKQEMEKDRLSRLYRTLPKCIRYTLKSQLIVLASIQAKLVGIIQKQMHAVESAVASCNNEHQILSSGPAPVVTTVEGSPSLLLVPTFSLCSTTTTARGNKVSPSTPVPDLRKLGITAADVPLQGQLWEQEITPALDVCLQNGDTDHPQLTLTTDTTTAACTTRRQPCPDTVQGAGARPVSDSIKVKPQRHFGKRIKRRKKLSKTSFLGSTSDEVDGLALLMNLRVIHVIEDDEWLPQAVMDQRWEQMLKDDSMWCF